MKQKLFILTLIAGMFVLKGHASGTTFLNLPDASRSEQQDTKSIRGIVKDERGEPIIGASIMEKGTANGTVTDLNGNFTIQANQGSVLTVSFVGFHTKEVKVNGTVLDIVMTESSEMLDELVVIGYGSVRRRDLTGSVSQINANQIPKGPVTNILQSLQGKLSGIQITPESGKPGSSIDVLIHGTQSINGTNSPIYVIDGAITESIGSLTPQDIETISVLKDASAVAIYGSRAANGVILVKTKRGSVNSKPIITFKTEQSIQNEGNLRLNYLNARQWLEAATEAYTNAGKDVPWSDEDVNKLSSIDNAWPNLIKRTGYLTNNNISITGGSNNSNYFISLNYLYNKGIVRNQDYRRLNLRLNGDYKIGKRITFGHSVNLYATKQQSQRDFDYRDTYHAAFRYSPLNAMYDAEGDFAPIVNTSLQSKTPSPLWMLKNSDNTSKQKGVEGNVYLTIMLIQDLNFTARVSGDWSNNRANDFIGAMEGKYAMEGSNANKIKKTNGETFHWITDYTLDYHTTIADIHNISALLGYSAEKQTYENMWASRGNTPNNSIQFLDAGDPSTSLNGNSWTEWSFVSQFGRIAYSLMDKYYLSGTVRRDGSSRLAKSRYGIFPSLSLAWRIGEERFMDRFDWLDEMKIRASIGKVGNVLSIMPYGTSDYLSQMDGVFNEKVVPGYTSATSVNTDLKWESTTKKNIGIDFNILNSRIYFVSDFYIEDTYDLLFQQPIAPSVGLTGSPYVNAGHVRNTGFDIELGYRHFTGDWKYDISTNLSHVKNEAIDLEGRDLVTSGIKEGYPIGSFYGYLSDGLNRTKEDLTQYPQYEGKGVGDIRFKDINGYNENGELTGQPDGKVNAADRALFGKVFPDFTYGVSCMLTWKDLSLQIQLQGIQGLDRNMLNGGYATDYFGNEPNMEADYILDRYSAKNPNGAYPRVAVGDPGRNQVFSDFWLVDASYLSIRNVNLSYTLPKSLCRSLNISNSSIFLGIQNLYTFGNEYSEIRSTVTVPFPRTYTLGFQFSL